jgi:hypothetical protein
MRNLFLDYLLYPLARFFFEFLGDHLWLAAILVGLVALLVWRFLWPLVFGFWQLFGWKGVALIAGVIATLGVFGAGWRAHRDATMTPGTPEYHGNKPNGGKKPKKIKDVVPLNPSGDDWLKRIFNGNQF